MQANRRTTGDTSALRAGLGVALLGLGLFLFFVQLDGLGMQFQQFAVGTSQPVGGTALPATIVVVQHLLHSWFFERGEALLEARQMLLSCWPLALVFFGILLIGRRICGLLAMPNETTHAAGGRR